MFPPTTNTLFVFLAIFPSSCNIMNHGQSFLKQLIAWKNSSREREGDNVFTKRKFCDQISKVKTMEEICLLRCVNLWKLSEVFPFAVFPPFMESIFTTFEVAWQNRRSEKNVFEKKVPKTFLITLAKASIKNKRCTKPTLFAVC